ncbi:MAG: hypothetical protein Q4D98_01565 [Planctomycetia bacterium]|nr:hypothetical protein [Planctomycetia bacterium]
MENEYEIEEYAEICYTGIVGGVLGFLTPLAVFSTYFWILPILSICLTLFGLGHIAISKVPMTGKRLAFVGLCGSLFFGTAGVANEWTYQYCGTLSAREFSREWLQLMVEGRDMEACQLSQPTLQRATGMGIVSRFTESKTHVEMYRDFQKNTAVRAILRDFQGAKIRFVRGEGSTRVKNTRNYTSVFELSVGEGAMKKTREFRVIVTSTSKHQTRIMDWTWRAASAI